MKLTPAQIATLKAVERTQNPWDGVDRRAYGSRTNTLAGLERRGLVHRPDLVTAIITQAGITALLENQ